MALFEARDMVSGYGNAEILHGLSMDVHGDEIVWIIDPNGAGKSTFMMAVFVLIDCWDGTVTFRGEDITSMESNKVTRTGIYYVPTSAVPPASRPPTDRRPSTAALSDLQFSPNRP